MDDTINAGNLLDEIKENNPERYNNINEVVKIRTEKIQEYKEKYNVPEFNNQEEYLKWLETEEGEKYKKALEEIREEANKTVRGRGGYRVNAGRKKQHPERIAIHKRVSKDTVIILKDFSKKHKISENEALEKLIKEGYEHLKEA